MVVARADLHLWESSVCVPNRFVADQSIQKSVLLSILGPRGVAGAWGLLLYLRRGLSLCGLKRFWTKPIDPTIDPAFKVLLWGLSGSDCELADGQGRAKAPFQARVINGPFYRPLIPCGGPDTAAPSLILPGDL